MRQIVEGFTVFLDRDGTINHDSGYIASPDQFTLFPGVIEGVARLNLAGANVVVVTNQSGMARGHITPDDLHRIHGKLKASLQTGGGRVQGIFVCPHHPDDDCRCRKPNPGLIEQAVNALGIDVTRSYVVGDKPIDMMLASNVQALAVLVTTSPYSQEALQAIREGKLRVSQVSSSFSNAVDWIIEDAIVREWCLEEKL